MMSFVDFATVVFLAAFVAAIFGLLFQRRP